MYTVYSTIERGLLIIVFIDFFYIYLLLIKNYFNFCIGEMSKRIMVIKIFWVQFIACNFCRRNKRQRLIDNFLYNMIQTNFII